MLFHFGHVIRNLSIRFADQSAVSRNHWTYEALVNCNSIEQISISNRDGVDISAVIQHCLTTLSSLPIIDVNAVDHRWTELFSENLRNIQIEHTFCQFHNNCRNNLNTELFLNANTEELNSLEVVSDSLDMDSFRIIGPALNLDILKFDVMENQNQDVLQMVGGRLSMDIGQSHSFRDDRDRRCH